MKTKLSLTTVVLIAGILISSLALAQVLYTLPVVNNLTTAQGYALKFYKSGTTGAITTYDWGEFSRGTSKWMEGTEAPTDEFVLENVGEIQVYVTWNATNLPIGFTLEVYHYTGELWIEGATVNIGVGNRESVKIRLTDVTGELGASLTFDLNWNVIS